MSESPTGHAPPPESFEAPFLHAVEGARTVFVATLGAAALPLLAGLMLFGWRAAMVAGICLISCGAIEKLYYRVTRTPALLGRSHAYLTAVLLALTLPAFVPWYVPLIASAFAIVVGKAIFGGVGHFVWQPALVGRLAVAVMFPTLLTVPTLNTPAGPAESAHGRDSWPVLLQGHIVVGDIRAAAMPTGRYREWPGTTLPRPHAAVLLPRPSVVLSDLTAGESPTYRGLIDYPRDLEQHWPDGSLALRAMPPMFDMLFGRRGGGIGETCIVAILLAGLYLAWRNYIKWHLPVSFLAAAACVVIATRITLIDAQGGSVQAWPMTVEGAPVGIAYLAYHLFSGELILAAVFMATEMTSRPVTTGGQVIFGLGCGALAMFLRLHLAVPIPCYMAVLAMNTFTPTIDRIWRPRMLG